MSCSNSFHPRHRRGSGQFQRRKKEKREAQIGRWGPMVDFRAFHKPSVGHLHEYLEAKVALGPMNSSFELL